MQTEDCAVIEIPKALDDVRIDELGLKPRTFHVLNRLKCYVVRDLRQHDLAQLDGFGPTSINDLDDCLKLALGSETPAPLDPEAPEIPSNAPESSTASPGHPDGYRIMAPWLRLKFRGKSFVTRAEFIQSAREAQIRGYLKDGVIVAA